MSRSQATPEEAEQYYRGPTIQQCRYPTSQDHNSTSSDLIHGQICTTRVYLSGLQTHLQQETSYESLRESPHNTVPDRSDAGTLDTGRTPLLSPDSMSDFQEGTEALPHYPRSGESGDANTAFQYTPNDVLSQAERQSEEGENLESTGSDEDEECNGAKKTKVERLAEKRKMKRFRSVSAISLAHTHQASHHNDSQLVGYKLPTCYPSQLLVARFDKSGILRKVL